MDFNLDELLHLSRYEEKIYPVWELSRLSFGRDKIFGVKDGLDIVIEQTRSFQLSCGHVIRGSEGLGGRCDVCFQLAVNSRHPFPEPVSWVCQKCYVGRCSILYCPVVGLCRNHAAPALDHHLLCPVHYTQWQAEERRMALEARLGKLPSRAILGIQSLFNGRKRLE